jgi:hypothetical protein
VALIYVHNTTVGRRVAGPAKEADRGWTCFWRGKFGQGPLVTTTNSCSTHYAEFSTYIVN